MSPAAVSVQVTQTFTESLVLNTGSDRVSAAEIDLTFDPTKVQVQSFSAGTVLPVVLVPASFDNAAGTASIVLGSSPTAPASGIGTVATITFVAVSPGNTSVAYASTTQTASIGKSTNSLQSTSGATVTISP
jgi:hypothetical protein